MVMNVCMDFSCYWNGVSSNDTQKYQYTCIQVIDRMGIVVI